MNNILEIYFRVFWVSNNTSVNHKNSIYSVHYHVFPDNTYIQSYIMTQQKQL